jgi:hypothetical protein
MSKVKKAWAGGVAGAVAAVAGFAFGPGDIREQVGKLVGLVVVGFVTGFVTVYLAPANETA